MKQFSDLSISDSLMRAIQEMGFTEPTPIQAQTLPLLLGNNTDFLGLAATGTGKTAAFSIPLLERMDSQVRGVQAMVLCPTRELAIQVAGQIDLLGKYKNIRSLPIYGGTGYSAQLQGLKSGANIVVGTPGRVVDHIEKGTLRLDQLKTLVLDEADEMISMGFKEDLEKVLQAAPRESANIWLFSATMGGEVRSVADEYLKNPQKVQVNRTEMLSQTVEQIYYRTHEYDKPQLLCKQIDAAEDFYGIIFCQTKSLVTDVTLFLQSKGFRADCLHGDLDQTSRDRVMKAFRERNISILVATDVACRGLDVKDVTHVINYSIPRELENYVHRIGRTARSGKQGLALSLVTNSHRGLIGQIERLTKTRMKEGTPPSFREITAKRLNKVRIAFESQTNFPKATEIMPAEWKQALAEMNREEIAARFLQMLMPDLFVDRREERLSDSRPKAGPDTSERSQRRDRPARRENRGDRPDRGDRKERGPHHPSGKDRRAFSGDKRKFSYGPRKESGRRTPPWERRGGGDRQDQRRHEPLEPQVHAPHSRWKSKIAKPRLNQKPFPTEVVFSQAPGGQARPKRKKFIAGANKPTDTPNA